MPLQNILQTKSNQENLEKIKNLLLSNDDIQFSYSIFLYFRTINICKGIKTGTYYLIQPWIPADLAIDPGTKYPYMGTLL